MINEYVERAIKAKEIIEESIVQSNRTLRVWNKTRANQMDSIGVFSDSVLSLLKTNLARPLGGLFNTKTYVRKLQLELKMSSEREYISSIQLIRRRYDPHPHISEVIAPIFAQIRYAELYKKAEELHDVQSVGRLDDMSIYQVGEFGVVDFRKLESFKF